MNPAFIGAYAFGILNSKGDFWTHNTFHYENDAKKYLEAFWNDQEIDLSQFRIVPVSVEVTELTPSEKPS